jgi:hypothetical protein
MSLSTIRQAAKAIVEASYKGEEEEIVTLTQYLRKSILTERKKYV